MFLIHWKKSKMLIVLLCTSKILIKLISSTLGWEQNSESLFFLLESPWYINSFKTKSSLCSSSVDIKNERHTTNLVGFSDVGGCFVPSRQSRGSCFPPDSNLCTFYKKKSAFSRHRWAQTPIGINLTIWVYFPTGLLVLTNLVPFIMHA